MIALYPERFSSSKGLQLINAGAYYQRGAREVDLARGKIRVGDVCGKLLIQYKQTGN